jgi:hypothetical protein
MKKENLVVLKGKTAFVDEATQTTFKPNEHYRCSVMFDEYIVYGVPFDKGTFNNMFEPLHNRMMEEWSENGLLPNMKPLSKSAFINLIDIHTYGRGKNKLFVGYVGNKQDGLWAFHPYFKGDTKARFINNAYAMYQDALNGKMDDIDDNMLQRGNSGYPLQYADIYFKKEYVH